MSNIALVLWNAELKARKLHSGCALEELCNHVFPYIRRGDFSYPAEVCVNFIQDFSSDTSPNESPVKGTCLLLKCGDKSVEVPLEEVIEVHDSVVFSKTPAGDFVMTPGRLLPLEGVGKKGDMVLEACKEGGERVAIPFSSIEMKS